MKPAILIFLGLAVLGSAATAGDDTVNKIIKLLTSLEAKIGKESEAAAQVYANFKDFCHDRATNLGFDIRTATAEVAELKASIAKETALGNELPMRIDDLASSIAKAEADLAAAIKVRAKEAADFLAEEKELTEIIDMLNRAIAVLQREMAKSGASMLEIKNAANVAQALNIMVKASMFSMADAAKITALVQNSQSTAADDADINAPDPTVYASHSGDIVETLQNLLDQALAQLAAARKKEVDAVHNFEMLKLSLEDQIKFDTNELDDTKADLAASREKLAGASSSLSVTSADLAAAVKALEDTEGDCEEKNAEHEAKKAALAKEIQILQETKKALTGAEGAAKVTYCSEEESFLQLSSSRPTSTDTARFVRKLAKTQKSTELAQLATRIASAVRLSTEAGEDPFAKVKGLISDLIARLEKEASADADKKAYCDRELAETKGKKDRRSATVERLTVRIEQMSARSAKLKEDTAAAQKALADLAKAQADMDKLREEENAAFVAAKADVDQGIANVKLATKILSEFVKCTEGEKKGASGGIIAMLEVVAADFTKKLVELVATEERAVAEYEQETRDNELEKVAKDKDVEYMTKEAVQLDKAVNEANGERTGVQAELDAVLEYFAKLKESCIAKPETYAERKRRREAELAGLREALKILEGQSVYVEE